MQSKPGMFGVVFELVTVKGCVRVCVSVVAHGEA